MSVFAIFLDLPYIFDYVGCNENIHEWKREANLLHSNLGALNEVEVFPNETLKDIIEPYDEAYEIHWKGKVL